MANTAVRMVIDDPENFHLLTTDMKEQIIKGGIATVNVQAALTRKKAIENIKDDFTLRNNFTTSQVQFTPMPQGRYALSAIHSTVGITERAGYMARQEFGGPHKPENSNTLPIPTNIARGGNRGSPVLRKNYLNKLKKVRGADYSREGGTFRSKLVARAAVAFQEKIPMRFNNKLFNVNDFKKSANGTISFKIQQLYGFDNAETITPETPWLKPATDDVSKDTESIFISQMKKLGM
jgi:hypothetical protein